MLRDMLFNFVTRRFFSLGLLILVLCATNKLIAQEGERLFPDSTLGFFSVANAKELGEQLQDSQLGQLLADPKMKPFIDDLRGQLQSRLTDFIGLSFDEIRMLPNGEICGGLIAEPGKIPGYILLLDVTGDEQNVKILIEKRAAELVDAKKAAKANIRIAGLDAVHLRLHSTDITDPTERNLYLLMAKNYLIVTHAPSIAELMVARINGRLQNPLAGKKTYLDTMGRCQQDRPVQTVPIIRWYIEPLQYGEAARVIMIPPKGQKRPKSLYSELVDQGFDAIKSLGGTVDMVEGEKSVVHRTFVFAPKPYRLGMKMVALVNSTEFDYPDWVPLETTGCSIIHLDILEMFDNFGTVFDTFIGGEPGIWEEDILRNLKDAPDGPKIDLRKELFEQAKQNIYGFTVVEKPINAKSERILMAVELKKGIDPVSGKKVDLLVQNALGKLFEEEREAEKLEVQFDGEDVLLWKNITEDKKNVRPDEGFVPVIPSLEFEGEEASEEDFDPVFPLGGFAVLNGYVFFANDADYLREFLLGYIERLENPTAATVPNSHRRIMDAFKADGVFELPRFFQRFSDTEETSRSTFETIRAGKMPESESLIGRLINEVFFPQEEGTSDALRTPLLDGTKMPPYDELGKYFGNSGSFGTVEENGWFIKGYSLAPE